MTFVYPNFLWAYLLIAIPIIIHLFNFRRYKTVYFSRVSFLKEVTEDSKSGTKLKHLLILLSRILAIICLVTAFAQPFIPQSDGDNTESVTSIYIDNSFSMQAEGEDGNLLNEVKNKAIDLVKSLDANEKINLLTTDVLSKHQRFYSQSEIVDMIKEIDFSAKSIELPSIINTQVDLLNGLDNDKLNKRIFLFSDFQKSTSSLENWSRPEVSTLYYKATPEMKGNVYIDSVWFETPVHKVNSPIELHYRIINESDEDQIDLPISLSIDGNNPGPKRISIPSNSFLDDTVRYTDQTAGIKTAELSISTNQLFFDDNFFFTYSIKEEVRILLISDKNEPSSNLEQLYNVSDYYNCLSKDISNVSTEDFKGKECVIFQNINNIPSGIADLAQNILKDGGTVVLIPGSKIDFDSWESFLSKNDLPSLGNMKAQNTQVDVFNHQDPLYYGVFETDPKNFKYPKLNKGYDILVNSNHNFVSLFSISNDDPFMYYSNKENGRIVCMSAPLNIQNSDFQNHALFAATFLRIAETATYDTPLYGVIGEMPNYPLNVEIDEKAPIHLIQEEFKVDVIPQVLNTANSRVISFGHLENEIKQSGIYDLNNQTDFNEKLGINYNRIESSTESFDDESLRAEFENAGWTSAEVLEVNERGSIEINSFKAKEYWRILLILALVFIAIEILLLKFWKS
ncbi:MAG: hypothetical protein ACI857_002048 [Arenicella sp.]|jgi:hypothetical protein